MESLLLHPRNTDFVLHAGNALLQHSYTNSTCTELINHQTHFTVEVGIGTPEQTLNPVIDTGSSAVIIKSCVCDEVSKQCDDQSDCFQGTNKSTTFTPPSEDDGFLELAFGSGDILVVRASDVVKVASESVFLTSGLMLMVDRRLSIAGHFEGILGLGIPADAQHGAQSDGVSIPNFMEEAGVQQFSICYNDMSRPGVLRLEPAASPTMLKNIGTYHWGLEFQGFSVGAQDAPVSFCSEASKTSTQDTVCAAIPDSGSTLMMGPREQIPQVFSDICTSWPRCNAVASNSQQQKDIVFQELLLNCSSWMIESEGLAEVPSLFLRLAGADGHQQTVELTSWAYISQTFVEDLPDVAYPLKDVFPLKTALATKTGKQVCVPLFGAMEFNTTKNGPIWILGTPLFYEVQVVFGLHPATLGFSREDCGTCSGGSMLVADRSSSASTATYHTRHAQRTRAPRWIKGRARVPQIDLSKPL